MKITLTSVLVDDQAKALAFYTDVLGFVPKTDLPLGEHTVGSPSFRPMHPTALSCCSSLTSTLLPKCSRRRWSRTGFPSPRSESRMPSRRTRASVTWACASLRSQRPWALSPPPYWTTHAAT